MMRGTLSKVSKASAAFAILLALSTGAAFAQTATPAAANAAPTAAELAAGKKIFTTKAAPACALCHTLKDADSSGDIGPVLDELKPDAARVEKAVRGGIGVMPSFKGLLSEDEIRTVAKYVSAVAGK